MSSSNPESSSPEPSTPDVGASEFEFDDSQNQLIETLARRMGLVGLVLIFFGALQMVNGVISLIMSRDPGRMLAAAEQAGITPEQAGLLKETMSGSFWSSPFSMAAIAFTVAGLLFLLVGVWTQQAASGFAGIVLTKGRDITRLMDALGSLNRKYGMIYYIIMTAAIISLLSIVINLWQSWRGGA